MVPSCSTCCFFDTLVLQPPSYRFRVLCGFQIESPETEMRRMGRMGTEFFFWGELFSLFCFCFCLCCFCRDGPPHLKRLHLQLKPWKKHNSRNNKAIIPKIFTHPMGTDVLLRAGIFQHLRFFLSFWQHLRELLYPQMGFLDRLVVPQDDPEKKNKCIYGLASFLNKSDKLIVLWSPKYFSRLWCTCLS